MALSDNLVSYWKFEGNSNDELGGNNGTDTSITYGSSYGKIDQGALFDAGGDKIDCASAGIPTGTSSRTFSAWVKLTGAVLVFVYGNGASAGQMMSLYMNTTNINMFGIAADVNISNSSSTGTWYHLVMTYNGTTVEIFKNGSSVGTGTPTLNTAASSTFTIGHDNGTWAGGGSSGNIDELGVWSRVLSGTEISDLYNGGAGLAYPFTTTSIKTINGLAIASVKTVNGLSTASVKTVNGLA